jgi:iron(III) transport system substrate-binding protein
MNVHRSGRLGRAFVFAAATLALPSLGHAQTEEVNVYTTREPGLIQPLFDAFTKETGIAVNAVFVESGLAERLAAEGANSPADVITVVDYGALIDFVDRGLTQPIQSDVLNAAVPENLRDPAGHWYALSMRARVIYASKDRVEENALTYEDLADPKWKGRVCIRSGQHPYNTALFAAKLAKDGPQATETATSPGTSWPTSATSASPIPTMSA